MKKLTENLVEKLIFQIVFEIAEIREMLNGTKGFALVGLAVRPGCSVVANPKEVQGLIFN